MNETIPRPINVISNKTFHFLKVSFTHFLEISQNLRAWRVCRIWLKLLDDVCVFVFQFLNIWMTLISGPRVWFGWITLTGKLLCCCFQISWFFADFSSFSSISGKICLAASFNGLSVCRSLKKLKNEGSTMFRGSAVQKLEEKYFSSKNLTNHLENMLRSAEMNDNDAIIFWYFERSAYWLSNEW